MDIETPQPILIKNPPTGGALMRGGLFSLRKRVVPAALPYPPPLRQLGLVLDPRRVDAYARLCFYTGAQGIPLTYPHLLAFPLHMALMLRRDFPYPLIGLVHLENQIIQHKRLDSGDALDVTVHLADWIAHEKGQAVQLATEVTRKGILVWQSTSLYLRLGVREPQGVNYKPEISEQTGLGVMRRWSLPVTTGRKYAAISGDANPIHTSKLGARLFGFPRPIAHGMWSKARAVAALLPPEPVAAATVTVVFKTPAYLGGGLTLLAGRSTGGDTAFELRDSRAEKPHLRGRLTL